MNKLILIGNLTRDPELRTATSGDIVCNFDLAVNEMRGREKVVKYFRISAWGQLGENCKKYLAKGRKAYVSGPMEVREYTGRDGNKKFSVEVRANEVEFLSSRNEPEGGSNGTTGAQEPQRDIQTGYEQVDNDDLPY